jgi:hypothetical protein
MRPAFLFALPAALMAHDTLGAKANASAGAIALVCSARVMSVADTGGRVNNDPVLRLTLRLTPPKGRSYVATIDATVSRWTNLHPGAVLHRVACDPANPGRFNPNDVILEF